VTVHRDKILIINPTINLSNLFWNKTQHVSDSSSVHHQFFYCTHSDGICHTGLLTACERDPDPARKLSANLCDIYRHCVYSKKLMMDRGTVRNM